MQGCGDHGCVIAKPKGMGTNMGCTCPASKLRCMIVSLQEANRMLLEANEECKMQGAIAFKELLLEASNAMMYPHIEGVFAVFEERNKK